ncbi:DCC1-like thiol-disulfide oxidoreductase family protein [Actinosynnema sp. CA-248983]
MTALTVLYDADCPFCRRAKGWLARQEQLVRLEFVPAGSEPARRRFPDLDHAHTRRMITVIGDRGRCTAANGRGWYVCGRCARGGRRPTG